MVERVFSTLVLLLVFGSATVWTSVAVRRLLGRPLVEYQRRTAVPWSGWDVLFLAFVAIFFEAWALRAAAHNPGAQTGVMPVDTLVASGAARLSWVALAVTYLLFRRGTHFEDMGFDARRLGYDARVGVWTFLAALIPVFGLQLLFTEVFEMPSEHPLAKMAKEHGSMTALVGVSVVAVVIAPLAEEFFFRVILQGWLEKRALARKHVAALDDPVTPGWAPIVLVSLLFGAMHYGHGPDPIALFVLSLFLGYLYRQTHRIFASLTVHACVNGLSVLQLWTLYLES